MQWQPRIVLGVCGGVSAYKAVEVLRQLDGCRVDVVMTANAARFIGKQTFAALANSVTSSLWDEVEPSPHTKLGQQADLIAVVPATARLIGAYANGICDDLLTTTLLATRAPVLIAPAMHTEMWEHPATVANIEILRSRGVVVVGPDSGPLAGGDSGPGRLADPTQIATAIRSLVPDNASAKPSGIERDLEGITVLVTAGGTREPIDPVRFIANRSSGKQGTAIAEDAARRGAKVHLVTTVEAPMGIESTRVDAAAEMHEACAKLAPQFDVIVMAAAVADFRPSSVANHKIKKSDGPPRLELEPTTDILASLAEHRRSGQVIVGFAAETDNGETHAREKLVSKNLDAIVYNDVSSTASGFEIDTNSVLFIRKDGHNARYAGEKRTVAHHINTEIARLVAKS